MGMRLLRNEEGLYLEIPWEALEVDRQGRRAAIVWSRSWQGGAATLHLDEEGWLVMIRSIWIT